MNDIPEWIVRMVEADNLYCNKCRKTLTVQHVISIGIHESSVKPHGDKLCIGVSCPECKDVTIFELKDMSLIEFAFEILNKGTKSEKKKGWEQKSEKKDILKELSGRKSTRKRPVSKKSKITKKEVNEVRRFLDGAKTHEDVLVAMGMSPDQISKYNYKKDRDK